MYQKLLKKLQALPKTEHKLTSGFYVDDGGKCGCVLGKPLSQALRKKLAPLALNDVGYEVFSLKDALFGWPSIQRTVQQTWQRLGLSPRELHQAQEQNDKLLRRSNAPEAKKKRYRLMVKWLKAQIAEAARLDKRDKVEVKEQ